MSVSVAAAAAVARTLNLEAPLFRTLHYSVSDPLKSYSVSFGACRIPLPPPHHTSTQLVFSYTQGGSNFVDDPRTRRRPPISYDGDEGDDEDEENDEDRSLDLLVRFVENVFKKVSKRARKAVRSVLPVPISPNLVGFAVNGLLMLAFLWILKAFLEVVCTLGSVVFVSILLIRGIWSGVSFLQEIQNRKLDEDELDLEPHAWNGVQPVT